MRIKGRLLDNFKRSISIAVLVTVTMVFLSGIAVQAASGEKITITWWYETILPRYLEVQRKNLIEPYERAHPNIEIKTVIKGSQQLSLLRTAIAAGTGPDIIMTMGPAEANRYARVGTLIPLDKYIKEAGLDKELAPLALELGRYMGEIYSLPKTFESMGLIYNKSLFEENGWKSPTNREEWEALCDAIKAKDIVPVSLGNAGWRATNEWFVTVYLNHYAGPENVYKALTGQLAWDNSLFVEAIEMLKQDFLNYWPRSDVYFSLDFPDAVPLIAMRKAAMMVVGSWAFQWVGDPTYWPSDDQWEWAPFPSLREGVEYPIVDIGVGTTLSVNKNSEHVDETAKFLVWMLGYKEGIGKLLRDFPGEWLVPIEIPEEFVPAGVDPVFAKHFRIQSELIKKGAYGYTTWTFLGDQAWQWIYEGIEQVWLGQITAEEYMKKWGEAFKKDVEAGTVPPIPERK